MKPRKIPLQELEIHLADRRPGGHTQTLQPKAHRAESSSFLPVVLWLGETSWSQEAMKLSMRDQKWIA